MREMEKLRTADLYYGAYLMSTGIKLERVDMGGGDKRKVFFVFKGPKLEKRVHEYVSGEAIVNLRYLKSSLKHLKGVVFEKMDEKVLV